MKTISNIDEGIGSPDWKMALCLLLAWIIITSILVKGVSSFRLFVPFFMIPNSVELS